MEIKQGFELLKFLIFECETFDLALKVLQNKLIQSKDLETILYAEIMSMLHQVYEAMKKLKNPHKKCEHLVVLVINSLIFNIYSQVKNSTPMELNNSMSVSQSSFFSINESSLMIQNNQMSQIVQLVLKLSRQEQVFKKLNQLMEFNKLNVQTNRRVFYGFLETIDYILTRQKIEKSAFYSNKKMVSSLGNFAKPSHTMHIQTVNNTIFSGKLNMIQSLLQDSSQKLGFSLARVYYAAMNYDLESSTRKCFNGILNGGGEVMIYNLYKLYVGQFSRKSELFINTKSALFQLIMATFYIQFLPVISDFAQIIKLFSEKLEGNYEQFYTSCKSLIEQQLINFLTDLPQVMVYRFNLLRIIINNHDKWKDPLVDSLSPIKMLFVNKFLFNPIFVQSFYGQEIIEEVEVIGNYVNDLFYSESVKKHLNNQSTCKLIQQVSETFQNMILYQSEVGQLETKTYFIDQLILRYDYEQLYQGLQRTKFSPKDETQFVMANLQKDIITSRTKRVAEVKLSNSVRITSEQFIQNILPQTLGSGQSSFAEFVAGMESGESKYSQFLKNKQEAPKKKPEKTEFITFNTKNKSELQKLSLNYRLSKF